MDEDRGITLGHRHQPLADLALLEQGQDIMRAGMFGDGIFARLDRPAITEDPCVQAKATGRTDRTCLLQFIGGTRQARPSGTTTASGLSAGPLPAQSCTTHANTAMPISPSSNPIQPTLRIFHPVFDEGAVPRTWNNPGTDPGPLCWPPDGAGLTVLQADPTAAGVFLDKPALCSHCAKSKCTRTRPASRGLRLRRYAPKSILSGWRASQPKGSG
ncbi:hypothetical protein GCM10020258_45420 [Sphingomonas yabuuchiae]